MMMDVVSAIGIKLEHTSQYEKHHCKSTEPPGDSHTLSETRDNQKNRTYHITNNGQCFHSNTVKIVLKYHKGLLKIHTCRRFDLKFLLVFKTLSKLL